MSEIGGPSPEEIFGDLSKAREGDPITKSAGQEALKAFEGNLTQEASPEVPDKDMQALRVAESHVVREVVTQARQPEASSANPVDRVVEEKTYGDGKIILKTLVDAQGNTKVRIEGSLRDIDEETKQKVDSDIKGSILKPEEDVQSEVMMGNPVDVTGMALTEYVTNSMGAGASVVEITPRNNEDGSTSIEITDNGPGFTEDQLAQARAGGNIATTKGGNISVTGGFGRGSRVADSLIAKNFGGQIERDNRDGGGASVVIRLPKGEASSEIFKRYEPMLPDKPAVTEVKADAPIEKKPVFSQSEVADIAARLKAKAERKTKVEDDTKKPLLVDEKGRTYEQTKTGIVVREGDRPIGQITLKEADGRIIIEDIGVDSTHQRQGIANKLTELAENLAREKGIPRIGALAQPDYRDLLVKRGYSTEGFLADKNLTPPTTTEIPATPPISNQEKQPSPEDFLREQLEKPIPGTVTKSEKLDVNGTPVTRETVIRPDGKPYDRLVVTSPVVVDLQKGLRPEDFTRLGGSLSAVQALVDRDVKKIGLNPDTSTKQEPSSPVVWRVPLPDGSSVDIRVQVAGLATTRVSPGSIHGASPNVEVPVAGGEIRAQRTLRKGPNPMGVDTPDPKLGLTKDAQEALRSEGDKVVITSSQGKLEINGKTVDANKPIVLKTQEAALVTVVKKGPDGKPQTTLVRLVPRAADPSMNSSRYAGEVEASQAKANADLKYIVASGLSPASGGVIPPDIGQKLQEQEARQIRAEDDMEGLMESLRGDRYTPDLRGSGRETMDPRTGEMKGESRYPRPETRQTPALEIPQAPNIRPLTERVVTRGSSAQNPKIAEAFQPEEYRQPDPNAGKSMLGRAAEVAGGIFAKLLGKDSSPEGSSDQRSEPQRRAPERQQEAIGDVRSEPLSKGTEAYQGLGVNPRVAEWYKQQGIGPQEAARLEEALKDKLAREGDQRALQGGQDRENRKVQSDQEARTSMAQRESALERGKADATRRESQNQRGGNMNEGPSAPQRQEEQKRPAQAPLPDSPAETNKAQGRGLLGGLFGGNRGGSERDAGSTEALAPSLDDLPPSPQPEIPEPARRTETPSGTSVTGIEDYTPPAPSQSEIHARNKYLESLINQGNEEEEEKKPPLVGSALPETPVGRAARDTQAAAYSPAMRNMPSSERQVYIETLEKIRGGENLSITDRVLAEQLRQMGREMSTKEADPLPEYPPVSGRVQNPVSPPSSGGGGYFDDIFDKDKD